MNFLKKGALLMMLKTATALVALVVTTTVMTPQASAYSGAVTNCVNCHGVWAGGGGSGHTSHTGNMSCTKCHVSVGDTPVTSTCNACHVVPGITLLHTNSGAATCVSCHGGTAAAENVAPAGYAGTSLNPCTDGLDNDGNLSKDGADSACVSTPPPAGGGVPADHTDLANGTMHKPGKATPIQNGCTSCHGASLQGGAGPSCLQCHGQVWSTGGTTSGVPADHTTLVRQAKHKSGLRTPFTSQCTSCHGADLRGGTGPSCYKCHSKKWNENAPTTGGTTGGTPSDHTISEDGERHKPGYKTPFSYGCTSCHGADLRGGVASSCYKCHGKEWSGSAPTTGGTTGGTPSDHTISEDGERHKPGYKTPFSNGCTSCHGADLRGGVASSCYKCHGKEWSGTAPTTGGVPADHTTQEDGVRHKSGHDRPFTNGCTACHGSTLQGGTGPSCTKCHGREWSESAPSTGGGTTGGVPSDHTVSEDGERHKSGHDRPFTNGCTSCHGATLQGGSGPSCYSCHSKEWSESGPSTGGGTTGGVPSDHTVSEDGERHKPGHDRPFTNSCTSCHGATLQGGSGPSCYSCHSKEWSESGPSTGGGTTGGTPSDHTSSKDGQMHKSGYNTPFSSSCTSCHGATLQGGSGPSCYSCHSKEWSESGPSTGGGTTGGTPSDHTSSKDGQMHKSGYSSPLSSGCTSCHGSTLQGGSGPSCYSCHGREW